MATSSFIDFKDENAELVSVFVEKNNLRTVNVSLHYFLKLFSHRHGFGRKYYVNFYVEKSRSRTVPSSRFSDSNVACWRRSPVQAGFILFPLLILSCVAKRNASGRRSRGKKIKEYCSRGGDNGRLL